MTEKILLVDDEPHVLEAYHRNLHRRFNLELAQGADSAILALEEHGPFAVVVSDMRMPGRSGVELLEEVRARFPEAIRIMLTGNADQQTAVDAVNRGSVFRFLNKPCSPQDLALSLEAGLRQFQLVAAERELLEETLTGAVKVLTEMASLKEPIRFELVSATRDLALAVAERLRLDSTWMLEVAILLAPLGSLCPRPVADSMVQRDPFHPFTGEELELSAKMIEAIPRLEPAAHILRCLPMHFDGSGPNPGSRFGEAIPLESRILFAALAFTAIHKQRHHAGVAMEELKRRSGWFDPVVLTTLAERVAPDLAAKNVTVTPLLNLREGDELAQDLVLADGFKVFPIHTRIGRAHLLMIGDLGRLMDLPKAIQVRSRS